MITILFTILSALYDNGKSFVDHKPRWIFRAAVVAIISYFEQGCFFSNVALNTAIFYVVFDYTLNLLEGRKWNYIGTTSVLDKLTNKYGNWKIQFIIKILLVVVTLTLKLKII